MSIQHRKNLLKVLRQIILNTLLTFAISQVMYLNTVAGETMKTLVDKKIKDKTEVTFKILTEDNKKISVAAGHIDRLGKIVVDSYTTKDQEHQEVVTTFVSSVNELDQLHEVKSSTTKNPYTKDPSIKNSKLNSIEESMRKHKEVEWKRNHRFATTKIRVYRGEPAFFSMLKEYALRSAKIELDFDESVFK